MMSFEREKIMAQAAGTTQHLPAWPEWARIPVAVKACGIGRTRLYELLNEAKGAIKTVVLKSPGAERGARLVHLPSLFEYLHSLANGQAV
jgi:hypothetical protein